MKKVFYLMTLLMSSVALQTVNAAEKAPDALRSMIESAMEQHPRLQSARAGMQAAMKGLNAANQAVYNPELEIDSEETDINTSTLQISQTIDMADQRGALTQVAQAALTKARSEFEIATLELQQDLLSVYTDSITSQELLRLSAQANALMKEFTQIAELRYKAGDLNQVELDLTRLAYSESIIDNARAMSSSAQARANLNALFARLPARLPALPEQLPEVSSAANSDAFLRSLPQVRAREAEVSIARKTVDLRRSQRKINPTIALRGGKDGNESLVGLTLSIPLNIRNTYSAEVEQAQQEYIQNQQAAYQAFRDLRARVNTNTQRFQSLRQAWLVWRKIGQTSISRQLQSIKKLWRAGDMSTSDYLVQLKQTMDTQSAGIELRNDLWKSAFEWMFVTATIDDWLNLTTELN